VKIADFGVAGIADADEGALADTIAEATPGDDQASPLASTGAPDKTPRLTATGVVLGTPLYMPPELAHGATNATFAADVYSFGVLAFETLTRERRRSSRSATASPCRRRHRSATSARPSRRSSPRCSTRACEWIRRLARRSRSWRGRCGASTP
jgi:serine/threonine protein kinase